MSLPSEFWITGTVTLFIVSLVICLLFAAIIIFLARKLQRVSSAASKYRNLEETEEQIDTRLQHRL